MYACICASSMEPRSQARVHPEGKADSIRCEINGLPVCFAVVSSASKMYTRRSPCAVLEAVSQGGVAGCCKIDSKLFDFVGE